MILLATIALVGIGYTLIEIAYNNSLKNCHSN